MLLTHPDIEQAASFSVKHPTLGEDVGVAVVIRAGRPTYDVSGDSAFRRG